MTSRLTIKRARRRLQPSTVARIAKYKASKPKLSPALLADQIAETKFKVDRSLAEKSFHEFVRQAWHIVEPSIPFVDNWHLVGLCAHLEAVVDGRIEQLLANVPPGTMKSLLTCVFWPAWTWTKHPEKRFMFSSYAESLSLRDSQKCRDVISSEWYQKRWPLAMSDAQDTKNKFQNEKGGWRLVGSVGGKGIGEHPDFNCLDGKTLLTSRHGKMSIRDIVEQRKPVELLSYNHHSKREEWRRITSYSKHAGKPCVRITISTGTTIQCTKDHPVFVVGKGYIAATAVEAGDRLVSEAGACKLDFEIVNSVECCGTPEFVYNVGVEHNHNYFAEGILTHNCADDIHNVKKAESEQERQNVVDWVDGTFSTRGVSRGVRKVVIMQRLHVQDASGHLLQKGGWEHICLPMRYEAPAWVQQPDGSKVLTPRMEPTCIGWTDPRRVEGELLWPSLYTEEKVQTMEINLGVYHTAGQLQQRPAPRGGGKFKRVWFEILTAIPPLRELVRYWDKSGTKGGTGAQTAGVLMGKYEDASAAIPAMRTKFIVLHVVTCRESAAQREALIKQCAEADRQKYGQVKTWVEQEPGSGGKESAESTVGNLVGFPGYMERVTGSKEVRADPLASQASVGKVKVLAAEWNQSYLDELEHFPVGKLKDMVDATSGAFNKLAVGSGAFGSSSELSSSAPAEGGGFSDGDGGGFGDAGGFFE